LAARVKMNDEVFSAQPLVASTIVQNRTGFLFEIR
jgi:hypothetical protein